MIALTGSKPQNNFPIETSISRDIKTPLADYSPQPAPAQTTPPPPPQMSGFQFVKRELAHGSCGSYLIPGFSLSLDGSETCSVDDNALMFGACTKGISDARKCGWAGACVDAHLCSTACGRTSVPNISVTTCGGSINPYCAMWYLVSEIYLYTSILCSNSQSWLSWDAILVTTVSVDDSNRLTTNIGGAVETSTGTEDPTSTSTDPSETSNSTIGTNSQDNGRSPAVLAGAISGALGGAAILVALVWFLRRHHQPKKRASRALAYDPADSSDAPEPPHVIGSNHESSARHSTGGPGQGHQMGYADSPLGSPNLDNGSIHKGGIRSSSVTSPNGQSTHAKTPVYEMHADAIGPKELPA
ncbi:hypothetical protein DSL72_009437 [Monilinia vaccinii-corymbosi]|uniref:Uncharacterized protein n=1 Tax=Monilinia vaccinii-corymbosi TaxID=61207 RepID=A0A8A3PR32_9HELO|nr:hypothetical protein DSL72_009437 [Monilinia vaccinii-corymbosi]